MRPTASQKAAIERSLRRALPKDEYIFYVARTGDRVDGYALFDEELGQHKPITFGVLVDTQGRAQSMEVLVYRETHGDEVRHPRFRKQFKGHDARSRHGLVVVSRARTHVNVGIDPLHIYLSGL